MTSRILSLAAAGLLFVGMGAMAQDAPSSSTSQTGATSKSAKSKKTMKEKSSEATSATQPGAAADTSKSSSVAAADKMFMKKAAEGGMAEVQLGQLAAEKASSNDVKQFGQQMVDDHGKANDQLKSIAEQKGVTLPTDLNAKDKAEKNRLAKLSGEQFDRAYMRHMVADHVKDVSEFKKESTSAKDNDVKNFASQTLTVIEGHLDKAKSIAGTTKASSASKTGKKAKTATSAATTPQ